MDFKEALTKVTEILPKASKSTCSFGWFSKNKHTAFHAQPCHARLNAYNGYFDGDNGAADARKTGKEIEWYYSSLADSNVNSISTNHDHSIILGNFLLSDTGPYRSLVKDRERALIIEDGKVYGFLLEAKPEDSRQMYAHLSVAGRAAQERQSSLSIMAEIVANGFDPAEAFVMSGFFNRSGSKIAKSLGHVNTGHSCIDPWGTDRYPTKEACSFNLKAYLDGTPTLDGQTWGNAEALSGTNKIFYLPVGKRKNIPNIQQDVVEEGSIKGRWSNEEGAVTVKAIMEAWETKQKPRLLELAA